LFGKLLTYLTYLAYLTYLTLSFSSLSLSLTFKNISVVFAALAFLPRPLFIHYSQGSDYKGILKAYKYLSTYSSKCR
jgi:hypothetical protein